MYTCLGSNTNSTVDIKGVTSDVGSRRVECQESCHTGNFLGLTKALQRDEFGNLGKVTFVEHFCHVGFNVPRAHGVDSDSTTCKLLCIRVRHTNYTTLGGCVVGLSRVTNLTNDTRNVHNTTSSLLGGNLEESLSAVKDTTQVDVNHRLPHFRFHAHDECIASDTSVVDQDVDGAILCNSFFKHLGNGIRLGCVSLDTKGVASQFLDFLDNGFSIVFTSLRDVVHHDLLLCLAHFQGNGFAQTTRGPCDQNDLGVVSDHIQGRRRRLASREAEARGYECMGRRKATCQQ
mmetsp:Transcript_22705/g.43125  ORF Transcript_22705/g.43125 Transcript_22705/m.43125 type:complete len:289 (+) Transcript_22705:83-949(+)